ncbi:MAG TPA: hypothetical protein DC024_00215 [Clostridiales bacterium]|nr:hypothetical protein [Clostridiales bacterium]
MSYRNGNYSAFYVSEPFSESNLGAHATKDFVSYNQLRMWKGADSDFPFNDSHDKNYNVRDGSDWEKTLKPRLHGRLDNSKNIILFLSSVTVSSRALKEEVDYGINTKGLPVIVIYPEYSEKSDIVTSEKNFKKQIKDLWDKLPKFRDSMGNVPTLHVPNKKALIKKALEDKNFMVTTKCNAGTYFFPI